MIANVNICSTEQVNTTNFNASTTFGEPHGPIEQPECNQRKCKQHPIIVLRQMCASFIESASQACGQSKTNKLHVMEICIIENSNWLDTTILANFGKRLVEPKRRF